jgi:nucleolar protein 56
MNKYKKLEKPGERNIKKILNYFKNKEFFDNFYNKNLELTKNDIKNSVKNDLLIIHTINNIEEIDKVVNCLVKRLREWYELYCPEFSNKIENHHKFVELILRKNKKQLLAEINMRESMGADLSKDNLKPLMELAEKIDALYGLREDLEKYLEKLMNDTCPSMKAITGSLIGAKLLEHAGSLKKMVEFPASTIQILGAEKALFRHMKNKKSKPPKYGILFQHPLIQKSKNKERGKVARMLADKISIAVKVDYFKGEFIGDKLRKELERKFK